MTRMIAERFVFHQRSQQPNESAAVYVAELRRLATNCTFGDFLDEALRDRFVCGLRTVAMQKRLLTEAGLTLKKAVELAQGMEAADASAKKLQGGEIHGTETPIHRAETRERGRTEEPCYRCGGIDHTASNFRFRETVCNRCRKRGHIARACRGGGLNRRQGQRTNQPNAQVRGGPFSSRPIHAIEQEPIFSDQPRVPAASLRVPLTDDPLEYTMFRVGERKTQVQRPIVVSMRVNGRDVPMEVDTGAAVSIISVATRSKTFPECPLLNTSAILTTYTGEQMAVAGEMAVEVSQGEQREKLRLIVVEGDGPSLLGREWLEKIRLDWSAICKVVPDNSKLGALLRKYQGVFEEGMGKMNTFTASLQMKPYAKPKFCKARSVPFSLKEAVEKELDRLEEARAIQKVPHSQWAAPIVPVPKANGKLRLCGDYKVTINHFLEVEQYPLPKPDELFATLAGGKKFTKIDLTNAYQQMALDEDSSTLVTINTHRGLYQYTRLPF